MATGAGAFAPALAVPGMQIKGNLLTTKSNPCRCICPAKNMLFVSDDGRKKGNRYERIETYGNRKYGG